MSCKKSRLGAEAPVPFEPGLPRTLFMKGQLQIEIQSDLGTVLMSEVLS